MSLTITIGRRTSNNWGSYDWLPIHKEVEADDLVVGRSRTFRYQEGTLVLDFVDAATNQLIWRCQAKGFVDRNSKPKKDDKLVNEAVRKILKNFPPRGQ